MRKGRPQEHSPFFTCIRKARLEGIDGRKKTLEDDNLVKGELRCRGEELLKREEEGRWPMG